MTNKLLTGLALGLFLHGLAHIAYAVPIYYLNDPITDRANFQAAASGVTLSTESFEGNYTDGVNTLSFPLGSMEGFTVSIDNGDLWRYEMNRLISDGNIALAFAEFPSAALTFNFVNSINYFGIDINDINYGTMSFLDNLGNSQTNILVGDQGGFAGGPGLQNLQFFGVSNTESFSTIQLSFINTDPSLTGIISVDRLQYGSSDISPVPEPATLLLFGTGLGGLAGARFRRKKN